MFQVARNYWNGHGVRLLHIVNRTRNVCWCEKRLVSAGGHDRSATLFFWYFCSCIVDDLVRSQGKVVAATAAVPGTALPCANYSSCLLSGREPTYMVSFITTLALTYRRRITALLCIECACHGERVCVRACVPRCFVHEGEVFMSTLPSLCSCCCRGVELEKATAGNNV